jgi:cytoskeletal protein CcmA (bactofilin family)
MMDIEGELHVGAVLDVTAASGVVITGDMVVSEKGNFSGELDVDGAADIKGGLQVEGLFQADNNSGTYSLVVDHTQVGLSGSTAGRLTLTSGVAQLKLQGDLEMQDILAQQLVVEGEFQAFGKVGLGASASPVTVYGEFTGEKSAEFKDSLKVSDDGNSGYHLVVDDSVQTAGISISARALDAGSNAFLTIADGKDALIKGDLGVKGDVVAGGDIWFGDYLKSKDEFLMQDSFVAGQSFNDKDSNPHNVYGYALASHADDIQAVLNNSAEALVEISIDGTLKKHINIMGILSGLIAGGSTLRYEYAIPAGNGYSKGATFNIGQVIHDETSQYKAKMKWYLNGQRLSDDDYAIVSGNAGKDISFNMKLEEDDVLIVDINDANPAA